MGISISFVNFMARKAEKHGSGDFFVLKVILATGNFQWRSQVLQCRPEILVSQYRKTPEGTFYYFATIGCHQESEGRNERKHI